jgi:hypothetical protein
MEKQGVIRADLTTPEHEPEKTAADNNNKKPTVAELDDDFRKRAAQISANYYRERADEIAAKNCR